MGADKLSDATGRISDEDVLGLYDETPTCQKCGDGSCPHEIVKFARALLAREGERVAKAITQEIEDAEDRDDVPAPEKVVRRLLGVPAREETRG